MGRRKINMEQVQDRTARHVTFTKRRAGLFKKASELSTLCDAEVGIVVFSPGGKPFSYGNPSVEAVTERYMKNCEGSDSTDEGRVQMKADIEEMNENLNSLTIELEAEKLRGEMLQAQLESAGDERFLKPMEELSLDELKEYKAALENMRDKISGQAMQMQASTSLMLLSSAVTVPANEDDDN